METNTKSLCATSPLLENVDQLLGYLLKLYDFFYQHTGIDPERKVIFYAHDSAFIFYIEVHYVSSVSFKKESDTNEGGGDNYAIQKLKYFKTSDLNILENWLDAVLSDISSTKIREEYK